MGMYTELKINIVLKPDTPQCVIEFLNNVINNDLLDSENVLFTSRNLFPHFNHEFFECNRWELLLTSTNGGYTGGSRFTKLEDKYVLNLHTEFKNYDNEVDKFINWMSSFLEYKRRPHYVGYKNFEDTGRCGLYIEE